MSAAELPLAETSTAPPRLRCSREEYLARELEAEYKNEYIDGEIWPMVGGRRQHVEIVDNLHGVLWNRLKSRAARVSASGLRVRAGANYYYPDVVLVAGEWQYGAEIGATIQSPACIIEVLSPSTENLDRGRKYADYTSISTLNDYVLVSQEQLRVEHFQRVGDSSSEWRRTVLQNPSDKITLMGSVAASKVEISLAEIYDRITF